MTKIISKVRDLIYGITNVFEYMGWGLLLFWVAFMTLGVLMRYLFSKPLIFQSDLVSGLLVIFCAFCFAPVFIQGGHIRVDLITRHFPKKVQDLFWLFADVVTIIFTILINVSSINIIENSFALNSKFDISEIPLTPFLICIPIGFSLLGLVILVDFFERLYTMITGNVINVEKSNAHKSGGFH